MGAISENILRSLSCFRLETEHANEHPWGGEEFKVGKKTQHKERQTLNCCKTEKGNKKKEHIKDKHRLKAEKNKRGNRWHTES